MSPDASPPEFDGPRPIYSRPLQSKHDSGLFLVCTRGPLRAQDATATVIAARVGHHVLEQCAAQALPDLIRHGHGLETAIEVPGGLVLEWRFVPGARKGEWTARVRLRPARTPALLSRQELRAAQLAGQGHTNAEIGRKLKISQHTARQHVSSALAKLGLKRRAQISEALRALGLSPESQEDAA